MKNHDCEKRAREHGKQKQASTQGLQLSESEFQGIGAVQPETVGNPISQNTLTQANKLMTEIRNKNRDNVKMLENIKKAMDDLVANAKAAHICQGDQELFNELREKSRCGANASDNVQSHKSCRQDATTPVEKPLRDCRKKHRKESGIPSWPTKPNRTPESEPMPRFSEPSKKSSDVKPWKTKPHDIPKRAEISKQPKVPKSSVPPMRRYPSSPRRFSPLRSPSPPRKLSPPRRHSPPRKPPCRISPPRSRSSPHRQPDASCPPGWEPIPHKKTPDSRRRSKKRYQEKRAGKYSSSEVGFESDFDSYHIERDSRSRDRYFDKYRERRGREPRYRRPKPPRDGQRRYKNRRNYQERGYPPERRRRDRRQQKRYRCPCMLDDERPRRNKDRLNRHEQSCVTKPELKEEIVYQRERQEFTKDHDITEKNNLPQPDSAIPISPNPEPVQPIEEGLEKRDKSRYGCRCDSKHYQSRYRIRHYDIVRPDRNLPNRRYDRIGPLNRFPGEPNPAKIGGHKCLPYYYTHKTRDQILRRIRRESCATYIPNRFYMPYRFWLYADGEYQAIQLQPLLIRTPQSMPRHFTLKNSTDLKNALEYLNPVENIHGQELFKQRAIVRADITRAIERISKRYDECLQIARRYYC